MNQKDMQIMMESYYRFIGIPKKKQLEISRILSYCKEIRNTAYPLANSKVTELDVVEFTARKEKDIYYINGSLSLNDNDSYENRTFEAYIFTDNETGKQRVYMDITRLCPKDEPKMIRTSEEFIETSNTVIGVTIYSSSDTIESKTFTEEFPKHDTEDNILVKKNKQLRAL